jgi:hypothetical protein
MAARLTAETVRGIRLFVEREQILAAIRGITWYHQIDLGHGVITPGSDNTLERIAMIGLPTDLRHKSVLDIGAWDGAFSFEAEWRGAARVHPVLLEDLARPRSGPPESRAVWFRRLRDQAQRIQFAQPLGHPNSRNLGSTSAPTFGR